MKTVLHTFIILLSVVQNLKGQQSKPIELDLKPILHHNGKYFYDGRRVSFDGLMFPMLLLNDSSINKQIRNVQQVRRVSNVVHVTSMMYIFLVVLNQTSSSRFEVSRNVIFSMLAFEGGLLITERILRRRVMERYNSLVFSPGVFVGSDKGIGVGMRMKF